MRWLLAPLSFAAATLIVYWSGWVTVWKLLVAVAVGFVVFAAGPLRRRGLKRDELDLRTFTWLIPYFAGLAVLTFYGQFSGGRHRFPFGVVLAVTAVFGRASTSLRSASPHRPSWFSAT